MPKSTKPLKTNAAFSVKAESFGVEDLINKCKTRVDLKYV
jgi:hypothetical protein